MQKDGEIDSIHYMKDIENIMQQIGVQIPINMVEDLNIDTKQKHILYASSLILVNQMFNLQPTTSSYTLVRRKLNKRMI